MLIASPTRRQAKSTYSKRSEKLKGLPEKPNISYQRYTVLPSYLYEKRIRSPVAEALPIDSWPNLIFNRGRLFPHVFLVRL